MSKIALEGNASGIGTFTISAPNGNTDRTLVLPDEAGTIITTAGVPASAMPAGSVIQVVNSDSTLNFSTSSTSYVDTGFSVAITPSSASNKVVVIYTGSWSIQASNVSIQLALYRDATSIGYYGDIYAAGAGWLAAQGTFATLDSPATTSAITYKLYIKEGGVPGTVSSNLTKHTLIAMEIAG